MQIPLSPHVIHTYIMIIERAYKIKEERKEGGEEGGRCPHTLPIESTGQLDTHLVPRPSKHTQGLHTPLLSDNKGVPLLLLRGLQDLDTPPNLSHTLSRSSGGSAGHTSTPTPLWRVSTHPSSGPQGGSPSSFCEVYRI